ncbi:hypothetical protein I8920_00440 [Curtobacterium sp. YC1]|uniref:hypothetical protein n=1 Tax=Curtobacterium sp. YC1 TaxID=2795488 RepID=UPI0018E5118E|nr:hypothetical protein [Curtobacterium sp. YC1]QQD76287.1 hypothetical protein I8920_00440 [Curtobacterium sp. YC1]
MIDDALSDFEDLLDSVASGRVLEERLNFFFGRGAPIEFDFDLREIIDDEAIYSLAVFFG